MSTAALSDFLTPMAEIRLVAGVRCSRPANSGATAQVNWEFLRQCRVYSQRQSNRGSQLGFFWHDYSS